MVAVTVEKGAAPIGKGHEEIQGSPDFGLQTLPAIHPPFPPHRACPSPLASSSSSQVKASETIGLEKPAYIDQPKLPTSWCGKTLDPLYACSPLSIV